MHGGVGEKRIDRLYLFLSNQLAQQAVPHHNDIQRVASTRSAIEVAHDSAIILVQNLDVNSVLMFEVRDQP